MASMTIKHYSTNPTEEVWKVLHKNKEFKPARGFGQS